MKKDYTTPRDAAELKHKAEEKLNASGVHDHASITDPDALKLLHELQVHQIELEMQNEELQQSQTAEVQYTALYDFAPMGYFTLDCHSCILQVNFAGAEMLNIVRSRLVNKRFDSFILPDTRPKFNDFLARAFEHQIKETIEVVLLSSTGDKLHVQLVAMISGNANKCLIAAVDITKRKQVEETLQDQHNRLGSIIEGVRAGTWEWNVQTGETIFNERWAQILGYTLDELSPISIKTWEDLTHPEDLMLSGEIIRQHLSGELPYYNSECRMKHKDGHWVWIHDSGKIITHTADGKPLMMYGTHIDITKRIFTEEALACAAERDHHIAEIFQQTAMPRHIPILPAHYEIGTEYQPALQEADVCGDFFDFFDLGDGDIGISIGDIAGKGLTAALRITAAKNMIRSYAFLYSNPSKVMSLVNDALCRDIAMESDMLTAFYAVLDTRNNTLTYSNAGHEPPLMRHSSGKVEPLKCGGFMFCGISKQDYTECRVILQPGDLFVMVTDGITEASKNRSVQYGAEGIIICLSNNADVSADKMTTAIIEDAKSFAGGTLHDDATIIVIKRVSPHYS